MEHYNRDNFEKSHTSEELYHRTSRSQSNSLKRKDFVVSFIASAIVGSAVGLYYKNKIYKKTDELKEKEQDLRSKVENYRQRAEDTMVSVKSKVEQLKYDSKDNIHADELQAQKAAIQRETDLADESPEAQAIQEAKKETKQVDDVRPSATELAAQQNAIQHETDLADESPEAQAIQEAKSEVDSNNKTSTTHIDSEKEPSAEEIAIAQTAVKEEARNHDLANLSASGEDTKSKSETETEKLAAAAKAKKDRINNNNEVASNTKNLMQEEAIKASNNSDVPNLVTNLNQSQASDTNSVAYRLAQAAKEKRSKLTNGSKETQLTEALLKEPSIAKAQTKLKRIPTLITESKKHSNNPHSQKNSNQTKNITATKEDSKGKQQHTPNQNKRNKQQKVEKTSSKIEKRTFND
ncbi:YtxH domain-containing protein [Staphylococcus epidermidis]|uniref:YtxH domain-containing protein n=1 Tax=Staphylococcus epidermidis TaxID=1282 RepID=UPI00066B6D92|nr:YtxH domain-containing protein [Staphylococcus epidermidis]MBU5608147.1 YtxH domain-containing protein [Staphylococcus epidermidis]MCG1304698.1 YtxH domain-containing protein [Staphylococcus epidermidis]MCG1597734.1 YtxH domain-containing protein [Staphylococcus epidermidis]MCG1609205.1 YtxH domain-containing protein [Staphylococcus epidermidis]MCG1625837.1 YtxH domain-containing protein [Staphylococcus epidermidis]